MNGDEELLPPLPANRNSVVSSETASLAKPPTPSDDDLFPVVVEESFAEYHLDSPSLVDHQYFVPKEIAQPMPKPSRLKSLKQGIRKLSLTPTKRNDSGSKSPSHESSPPPGAAASVTSVCSDDQAGAVATAATSVAPSTSSARASRSASLSSSRHSIPRSPKHSPHSSTSSLSNVLRTRAASVATPLTPPLTSPVITLSDNLSSSKLNVSSIEQSYFTQRRARSVADLTTVEELMEYTAYLSGQRRQITDAYDATHQRLSSSGWCTSNDLDNLQIQHESSLCQIDTKLIQIEERLNREFGVSYIDAH
ncbi:hypothetical protein DIURU_003649 [Diutina rugosa]|uniref:Uncharacterized protein n=1 Tax=Diutina rugosa TaxID=5481 RepID=A0A642UKQ8_DIURU|nr:uncharacterized protein DIURU_003649 [Diutina rugosa]KAA8900786.1 hypothetical protein DIURU_003649 [Diutina rugosa]